MISSISRYKHRSQFKSWLFTIASNHLKNYYRFRFRHPEPEELDENTPEIFDEATKADLRNDVQEALLNLPVEQKEAIVLRYYQGFTFREIAEITGENESTIKARVRYGMKKLKSKLEGYDG